MLRSSVVWGAVEAGVQRVAEALRHAEVAQVERPDHLEPPPPLLKVGLATVPRRRVRRVSRGREHVAAAPQELEDDVEAYVGTPLG